MPGHDDVFRPGVHEAWSHPFVTFRLGREPLSLRSDIGACRKNVAAGTEEKGAV